MKLDYAGRLISKICCALFFGLFLGFGAGALTSLSLELLQKRFGYLSWCFLALSTLMFGLGWFTEEES